MTIEPLYVIDTHALFWYLTDDKKLSETVSSIFEAAEHGETRLIVSAIVIAELYYLNQKVHVFDDFSELFRELEAKPYFQLVSFEPEEVLTFTENAAVPEMHDRILTGLARRLSAPLLTIDQRITASNLVEVIW